MTATKTFSFAVVGAGGIAGTHASAARDTEGEVAISHAVDANPDAARTFADTHGSTALDSFEDLLKAIDAGTGPDALLVCTPPSARLGIVTAAVERKLPVLVEKPLAQDVETATKLQHLYARNQDVPMAIAYCHRFAPPIVKLKELVAADAIGRMTRFENHFAFHHPPMAEKWMSDASIAGGGSFIDTGSHSLDLFRFLVGPAQVAGAVYDHEWPDRAESGATVLLRSQVPGVAGVINAGWMEPEKFTLTLTGTGGTLHYDYMDPEVIHHTTSAGTSESIHTDSHEHRFKNQLLAFAEHARGGPLGRLATFDDGLAANTAVDEATRLSKII